MGKRKYYWAHHFTNGYEGRHGDYCWFDDVEYFLTKEEATRASLAYKEFLPRFAHNSRVERVTEIEEWRLNRLTKED